VPATMVRRRGERFCFEDLASTDSGHVLPAASVNETKSFFYLFS
jgi:hypothetical protein